MYFACKNRLISWIYSPTPSPSHYPKQARKKKQNGKKHAMGSYQWMYILLLVCFIYVEVMPSTECTTMSFNYNNSTDVTDHFRYVVKVGWKCKHCNKIFVGEKKTLQRWKVHLAFYHISLKCFFYLFLCIFLVNEMDY